MRCCTCNFEMFFSDITKFLETVKTENLKVITKATARLTCMRK